VRSRGSHTDREQWIAQYRAMRQGVDAALFMTDAKLKIQHGIDLKVFNRATNPAKPPARRKQAAS